MKKIFPMLIAAVLSLSGCGTANISTAETASSETSSAEVTEETTMREIDPDKPVVALTFDDGPNTVTTVQVLNKLEEYGVTASFFLVGTNITDETKDIVKRAYDMGCEIDSHSKTHSYMNQMTADEIKEEISYVDDKLMEIIGKPAPFFRPPYIAVNDTMYQNIDKPFICGFGCDDWDPKVTIDERTERTLEQVQDGAIILLHDSYNNFQTVAALDKIIPALQEQGYQFVTVTELFNVKGVEVSGDDTNLYSLVQSSPEQ